MQSHTLSTSGNDFGARLREKRESLGLSQEAFAEMMGVRRLSQINYESGKREPPLSYLKALQKAGIDVPYLLDWQEEATQNIKSVAYFHFLSTVVTLLGMNDEKLRAALDEAYRIALDAILTEGEEPSFDEIKLKKGMTRLAMKLLHNEGIKDFS